MSFDIDAHEYQGRWFNSIRAWKVVRPTATTPPQQEAIATPLQQEATTTSPQPEPIDPNYTPF